MVKRRASQNMSHPLPLAPEVLNKKGYSWTIDWWSLGVCTYELIFGRRPFRGKTNSDLTHSITRESLRFPENAEEKCSREGLHAIASVRGFNRLCDCALILFVPSSSIVISLGDSAAGVGVLKGSKI